MNYLELTWATFTSATGVNFVDTITKEFSKANLIGILAGVIGITIAFTLVWRFAGYIRRSIVGGMTNSKGKGKRKG